MPRLWISQNIKQLFSSVTGVDISQPPSLDSYSEASSAKTHNTPVKDQLNIVVATTEQKKALKEWVIEQRGGALGWDIFTPSEAQRRTGALGLPEVILLAKAQSAPSFWSLIPSWAEDLFAWTQAGYAVEEIPFPGPWHELTVSFMKKLKEAKKKIAPQVLIKADIALGFDPLEFWGIEAAQVGLVVGPLTPPAEAAIVALEHRLGEAHWCEVPESENSAQVAVASDIELIPAIKEAFASNPELKRIVYQGELARAALVEMQIESENILHSALSLPWRNTELKRSFCALYETAEAFLPRQEFLREWVVNGKKTAAELKEEEKTAQKAWQSAGALPRPELKEFALPELATVEEFCAATKAVLGEEIEPTLKKISTLAYLLPAQITRQLWLEGLKDRGRQSDTYGGIAVLPLERAHGLIDENTLVVCSANARPPQRALVEAKFIRQRNEEQYRESHFPERGYLEVDSHRRMMALKEEALKTASWVRLKDSECEAWPTRSYQAASASIPLPSATAVARKQALRRDEATPFGENDYALPLPMRASCKQWEAVMTTPEQAWYDLVKLVPLWDATASPVPLCVGTWVHEALAADITPKGIDAFFETLKNENASLVWRQAHMSAWKMALGFAKALQKTAADTLEVEKNISGVLEIEGVKINLRGRIDRILKNEGRKLIVDFKTGSSASTLSEKKLEDGDGLQLWLYGRLLRNTSEVGLCRLSPEGNIKEQVAMHEEYLSAEARMAHVWLHGVLGQKGELWGRFGAEERLPLAALPVDGRILKKRAEAKR